MTKGWKCICGKEIDEGELYCSDRCRYIARMTETPLGAKMDMKRAVRFFGKIYDRKQSQTRSET